jgi:RimJ/RimL family protein N-acetyltransferase
MAQPVPPGIPGRLPALVWAVMHVSHLFANRAYAIVLMRHGSTVVHHSFLFPRYFRFPFMGDEDLQVGDTWTEPAWRGRGLARVALLEARHRAAAEGRCVWYVTDKDNTPSQRVAESCGFRMYGRGVRTSRWNLRALGAFVPTTLSSAT